LRNEYEKLLKSTGESLLITQKLGKEPFLSVIAYNIWDADRLERNKITKEVIKITMFQRSYDPV
jgi:hypothetical protein